LTDEKMRQYAKLLVHSGANIQNAQEVEIKAELDQPEFIRILVEECYKAGASRVIVTWQDQMIRILDNDFQSEEILSKYEKWQEEFLKYKADNLVVEIYILSEDPGGMLCKDQTKMVRAYNARRKIEKPYRIQTDGKVQWLIAAVPGKAWAKKLFPELSVIEAEEKLWNLILECSYENEQGWKNHIALLKKHQEYLNSLCIDSLHYFAGNGTDLEVGLIPESHFCAGEDKTISGIPYCANIPTEECYISPMKGAAEGIVYSTKPLSYQGQIIENFSVVFKKGKVVDVSAEKNQGLLEKIVNTDNGSAFLGECALVPFESPINRSGVIFQETLFDENACCHLALGEGFAECLNEFETLSYQETREKGINESTIHVDFMIGTDDLQITAHCRDGKYVPIFKYGTWYTEGGEKNV
jgi:aminopeptidase